MLEEAGVAPVSYATLKRRLPAYVKDSRRRKLSAACAAHAGLGPASLVLTVVADAGVVSEANQKQIEAAVLSFIPGARIPYVPYLVAQWRREHPGQDIPDGQVFTQPWLAGPNGGRRDQVIYYQYRADRARRTLRGIDEQVKKAEQAVAGKTPVKRNRFIQLSGGTRTVTK